MKKISHVSLLNVNFKLLYKENYTTIYVECVRFKFYSRFYYYIIL